MFSRKCDDTSLYVTVDEDAANAANQLNDDLNQISTWAETWLVKFNANKSKTLTVTLKRNLANLELPLSFNNTTLKSVVKHKHLGVELSTNLSWKDHVTTISENADNQGSRSVPPQTIPPGQLPPTNSPQDNSPLGQLPPWAIPPWSIPTLVNSTPGQLPPGQLPPGQLPPVPFLP